MRFQTIGSAGFTIVELLIAIIVIAVLGTVSVTSFSEVQHRSRDSRRVSDMNSIVKSLELYKTATGRYPSVRFNGLGSQSGWESSAREASGEFLHELRAFGLPNGTPLDPTNDATDYSNSTTARRENKHAYLYYRYPAGHSGCDVSRGPFYVLGFLNEESNKTQGVHQNSPGWSCPNRDWQGSFDWVTGGFTQ